MQAITQNIGVPVQLEHSGEAGQTGDELRDVTTAGPARHHRADRSAGRVHTIKAGEQYTIVQSAIFELPGEQTPQLLHELRLAVERGGAAGREGEGEPARIRHVSTLPLSINMVI